MEQEEMIQQEVAKMLPLNKNGDNFKAAMEENMRQLMSFRKDELVLPDEEEEDDSSSDSDTDIRFKKSKVLHGVQEA